MSDPLRVLYKGFSEGETLFFYTEGAPVPGVEFFFFIDPASVPSWLGEKNFSVTHLAYFGTVSGKISRLLVLTSRVLKQICEFFNRVFFLTVVSICVIKMVRKTKLAIKIRCGKRIRDSDGRLKRS